MTDLGFEQSELGMESTGYNLITPSQELLQDTVDYIRKVQPRKSAEERIFIPAGVGVLINPQGQHRLFSNFGVKKGEIYDVPPLEQEIHGAETDDVLRCGVFVACFDGRILFVHAGSPHALKDLVSRGFNLAKIGGADLSEGISGNVFYNSTEGNYLGRLWSNSEKDWTSVVDEIGIEYGLNLGIKVTSIHSNTRIIR